MKRTAWICLVLLMMTATFSLAAVTAPARVRLVDGDVLFRTPDSDEWLPAAVNTPLDEGDAIWCPDDARAEIQLPDGSLIKIDQNSELDLLANEDDFIHLYLASGRAYLRTGPTLPGDSLQIDAEDTTVLPAARTKLRIDILPDGQEDVSIFKGSAYVEGNGSRTNVRAGEHIALDDDYSRLLPLNPPDSWEEWNRERDRELSRPARSASPLPEELQGYSSELDSNGAWVRVPDYGMVWRPRVIFSADWAPYRSGRWIWKGDDYVWISFENWGWVPYHYGRWAVVSGLGWCWVPPARGDAYWGPGYVGWYRTGSHVGWTPLAPGETFYGRRNYGRYSVNITTTRVNPAQVTYRNRRVRGGTTVLPQNDFLRGRIDTRRPSANTSVTVTIGSPRLQPLRETRMPIVRQTPPRVAPPRIERRDSRELRQRFPRVTAPVDSPRRVQPAAPAATARPPVQTGPKRVVHPAVEPAEKRPNPALQPPGKPEPRFQRQQPAAPAVSAPAAPVAVPAAPAVSGTVPQRIEQPQRPQAPTAPLPPKADAAENRGRRRSGALAPVNTAPSAAVPQRAERQRVEQPQRPAAPSVSLSPQPAAPPNGGRRQNGALPPPKAAPINTPAGNAAPVKAAPSAAAPQPAERPKREAHPEKMKDKKVWRVTTPETEREQDQKDNKPPERERRGR